MKHCFILTLAILLSGCYTTPRIEGFDTDLWKTPIKYCDQDKLELAKILEKNEDKLLGEGQTQIKKLLGQPDEHELYRRTEKFFYYNLTAGDTCNIVHQRRLSIRFDALDRTKEVVIIE
ncbi:MAG: hypothetical protein ABJ313_12670 [Cyclobacteriaceae bacterium]